MRETRLSFRPVVMENAANPDMSGSLKPRARRNPKASKQALIDATLDVIAEVGITDTTVSTIIARAGLSRGMIHLHFGGKDNLLTSAARQFSDAYYSEMDRQLRLAGHAPQEIVMAVVAADLGDRLLTERSARIWHAFRGVSNTHPGIATYSNAQDARLNDIIRDAFDRIAAEYGLEDPGSLAHDATYGTLALLEGMWVHFLSDQAMFSRDEAISLIRRFLAGLFPRHF